VTDLKALLLLAATNPALSPWLRERLRNALFDLHGLDGTFPERSVCALCARASALLVLALPFHGVV
jgi:hypothetical protein